MEDSAKVRLVRCPKCENLLPELADYSVYQCGGCGAVLRAKHKGYVSGSLSDEGKVGGDSCRSEGSLVKGLVDPGDTSGVVDANSSSSGPSKDDNPSDMYKADNRQERILNQLEDADENGVFENDVDINRDSDRRGKAVGREHEEAKTQIGHENGSKFSGRNSNWQNGETSEMERFWRKQRADMESVRFSTMNLHDEGPSNGYSGCSSNYMDPWWNNKETNGANKVQHLEQDRAELLRKLDELKDQLGKSSEVVKNPKEKVLPDERVVPPDPHPYGGPDPWFSDGLNRTSRQFFRTDKHMAGPPHFNYHHDPYLYTSGHEMPMPNFHPSVHNPNQYGDPFASQTLRRGPHQLPHQFPQSMHPYFPGRYVDANLDSYEPYAHNAMPHPPSCSCFHCYDNKRRGTVPMPPASFINSRFPDTSNDPMLYHREMPGAFGPHVHNSRTSIPPVHFHKKQLHTRWPSDFNSDIGGVVRSRPRNVMVATSSRRCRPVAGGSPFITCPTCFESLQLPKKAIVMGKNHQQKVQCGACSSEISFALISKKLVISPHSETERVPPRGDDSSNEVLSGHVSHSRGHVNRSGANFSSDDYSGYDFLSIDKEPLSLVAMNSDKSHEMQNFHSSPSTSEDENSPEVMIASREVTKSILHPTKDSVSPPAGSPLQEYFDYSSNSHAVNRFGKGNRSSRSEQEKAKLDKITSRQNSLKEAALATEMDVHDYSNTGVSQDSRDASQDNGHAKSNKGGESFFANIIKKSFRDFSRSNQTDGRGKIDVTVNGQPLSDRAIKKAEKLAGPIQPGNYWYDIRAGFWGVMGGPCLGIIPPFIEEFNHPMPDKCSGGSTGVFVNGRELHQKDLDLLSGRGLPSDGDRSYIIEISGRVLDEDTGEELDCLGKLAPTVEKVKHGFGMKAPRAAT